MCVICIRNSTKRLRLTLFVENGKAVASSPSDQGLITAWRMSANKLLEIVGEVTRLFAELNMYGYDSLARAAAGAAGNGNGGQAQQPRHVPIELPPPIPPPPSQVSRLISRTMDAFQAFFN